MADNQITHPLYTIIPGIPKRDPFVPIVNERLTDFYALTDPDEIRIFRQQEIETLAGQIRAIPALPFNEAREREMLRLMQYYEAFATLFGIDLREVARTRTQINATVMYTSPILLQAMFDDKGQQDSQGLTFFESRIQAGGFSFNATSINIIEGYPMSFSVLKRVLQDASGVYEIDYPAVSLPREAFWQLVNWHSLTFSEKSFSDNPILTHIADTFSYRIHDWIHQAILYDTDSATRIFQKWSDDSYFVEHFFHDPAMINYEFMSDKIHYLVWQQIFDEHPGVRESILANATIFLDQLDNFDEWLAINGLTTDKKLSNFLGYVGLRGLFNIIPLDILKKSLEDHARFDIILSLLPEKYVGYLSKLYEPIDQLLIPFRTDKDTRISLQQILEEYVSGLREEFQTLKLLSVTGELWRMGKTGNLQSLLAAMPPSIIRQLEQYKDISHLDPRIFVTLNKLCSDMSEEYGQAALQSILARVEMDTNGYFYLCVEQEEVDLESGRLTTVPYQKTAILIQVPWDYGETLKVTLARPQNVLITQIGASENVHPGGVVLVNIENKKLASQLLDKLDVLTSKVAFDEFWQRLTLERSRGHITLGDAYPYEWEKLLEVFTIQPENMMRGSDNRPILRAGHYQTKPAHRRAARLPGPISMNSGRGESRRRVLSGCLVENHIQTGALDLFPVDAISFDKFYIADRLTLPSLKLSSVFAQHLGIELFTANQAARMTFKSLTLINDVISYGFRGKPPKISIHSLLAEN